MTLPEIATILRSRLGDRGAWIPTRVAPDWLVRPAGALGGRAGDTRRAAGSAEAGFSRKVTNMPGWQPRSAADTLTDTAESLLGRRLVVH